MYRSAAKGSNNMSKQNNDVKPYEITIIVRLEATPQLAKECADRLHSALNNDYNEIGWDFEVSDPIEANI
jgi:hypothetical protein